MSLDKKIKELDDFIDNFLKKHFHKADVDSIRPHLINYIKNDKNVITFSGETSEEAEFAIEWFIKKACDKYYKQVTAYKEAYFNEQDGHPSSNHLIDNVLDRFFDSMKFYIDEFLAEEFPNQTLFLERATVLKGVLTDQHESIRNKLLESISKSREQIRLSLREDETVQYHAKLSLDYSPYNLEGLCLLEELIEKAAKFGFFKALKNILDTDIKSKDSSYSTLMELEKSLIQSKEELSKLDERAKRLKTATIKPISHRENSEKEAVSFLIFSKSCWKR